MARTNNDGTPVDPDNDRMYCRPAAWRKAKEALGDSPPCRAMLRLQNEVGGCPRFMLVVAIGHFLSLSPAERAQVILDHCGDDRIVDPPKFGPRAEALPNYERAGVDRDFRRALGVAYGRPDYHLGSADDDVEAWMRNHDAPADPKGCFLYVCRHCGHELRDGTAMIRHLRTKHGQGDAGQPAAA